MYNKYSTIKNTSYPCFECDKYNHKTTQCKKLIQEIRNKLGMPVPENVEAPNSTQRTEWVAKHKATHPDNTDAIVIQMPTCKYTGGKKLPD